MKEEKNLDRLFQEKFKDFERHPSDAVWKNIAAAQKEEKEDRKIIPLWWKLGGAAAVIALLFTAGMSFFSDESGNPTENDVVTVKNNPTQVASPNEETARKDALPYRVVNSDKQEKEVNNLSNTGTESNASSAVVGNAQGTNSNRIQGKEAQINNSVVNTSPYQNTSATGKQENSNTASANKKTTQPLSQIIEKSREELLGEQLSNSASAVTQNTQESNDVKKTSQATSNEKISLVDEAKRIDQEKEDIALVDNIKDEKRWDVGAVAAPVYYGDFGGSGIDPAFSDNAKSGDVNFSYGVQVSYNLSPKIKVRTGVNNVDLSYNTNGIAFAAAPGARRLAGINYNENARALNITDAGSTRLASAAQDELFGEDSNNIQITNGSLQQRIGFVEIPIEGVYVVSDKRLGIQVVGGISTLLLNNNEIILNAADGLQSNLGSANGVNDVSFTTNVGVGLDYKMTDKLKLNIEPSLKYQLNAFDQSVGDFKPYFIGLYTGVSYRF